MCWSWRGSLSCSATAALPHVWFDAALREHGRACFWSAPRPYDRRACRACLAMTPIKPQRVHCELRSEQGRLRTRAVAFLFRRSRRSHKLEREAEGDGNLLVRVTVGRWRSIGPSPTRPPSKKDPKSLLLPGLTRRAAVSATEGRQQATATAKPKTRSRSPARFAR